MKRRASLDNKYGVLRGQAITRFAFLRQMGGFRGLRRLAAGLKLNAIVKVPHQTTPILKVITIRPILR